MSDWRADLFDPHKVPFSCRGSFHAVSWIAQDNAFWLRNLRGGDEDTDLGRLLRLTVLCPDGTPVQADWTLHPDHLTATTPHGTLHLTFANPDRLDLSGTGLGLRLETGASKYNYAQPGNPIHICIATQDLRCNVTVPSGTATLTAPWNGLSADRIQLDLHGETLAATLDLFRVTPSHLHKPDFASFRAALPQLPVAFAPGHLLAAYILWSAFVPAEGALTQPSVYMSKNWMTNIWSWDHCFVALAFAKGQPDLAYEQMQAIFDSQHPSGRLPDYINDRYAYWAFTKPPVHGWTFAQLRAAAPAFYTPDRMRQTLNWLTAQTRFWRDGPSWCGLPAYRHGNDAGWDNATCFAEGTPLVAPDLTTFLILQLDEIAALHRALGDPVAAQTATQLADTLLNALCTHLWTGTRFTARLHPDGRAVDTGQSLLLYLPLLLGPRLPAEIRDTCLATLLASDHLTRHGLATEATSSPLYRANGYWRGPIWAPTTVLFVDALRRCGQTAVADDLSLRYLTMCQTHGMAENHDAQTGQGLHDPAFAWTSAAFLTLGQALANRSA